MEIYKNVPGYEGHYQVSNFGNVKSIKFGKEIILKGSISKKYHIVGFKKNGKKKTFAVHVLVAMVFLGHVPDGTHKICVDHIDNNSLNNRADNLQLISARENTSKDRKGGASQFVGVHFHKPTGKWIASIQFKDRRINLGLFKLDIDASNVYQKARLEDEQGLNLNEIYPRNIK